VTALLVVAAALVELLLLPHAESNGAAATAAVPRPANRSRSRRDNPPFPAKRRRWSLKLDTVAPVVR
jgi:hypothetical protein